MRFCSVILVIISFLWSTIQAQIVIYDDDQTLITGTWNSEGLLTETMDSNPFEGANHYQFEYDYPDFWAGFGLNLDAWGNGVARDLSGYSHLRIAYRGMATADRLTIQLRGANAAGNIIDVGSSTSDYLVVDIAVIALTAGTDIDLTAITEINLGVTSSNVISSGTVFIDALLMIQGDSFDGTSTQTWSRFAAFDKGANLSNWLEAGWLGNSYPDEDYFTREDFRRFVDAGFTSFRLPVIFEYLADENAPYNLNQGHAALELVDDVIEWAQEFGVVLLLVNHHGYPLTDANYFDEIPRKTAVWRQLIERYGDLDPSQFFFELYNEPQNQISNSNFRTVAQAIISEVRSTTSRNALIGHSLIVGANFWNSGESLVSIEPYADADIIYTFHSYDPFDFTHQGFSWTTPPFMPSKSFPQNQDEVNNINALMSSVKQWADFYSVPVFLGEFGVSAFADDQSRCNYIETVGTALDNEEIPWFYWDPDNPQAFGFMDETVTTPCFTNALGLSNALPVELLSFVGIPHSNHNLLSWTTSLEIDTDKHLLERSLDLEKWTVADRQNSQGSGAEKRHYVTRDYDLAPLAHYRLRTIDHDGSTNVSHIISIQREMEGVKSTRVYPTLLEDEINIVRETADDATWHVLDITGRIILHGTVSSRLDRISLPFLKKGVYQIIVMNEDEQAVEKLIKL